MVNTIHQVTIHPIAGKPERYQITHRVTGEHLAAISRVPACDAARRLMERGADPADRLEVYREGRSAPDIIGSIGWFAARTVNEPDNGPAHFAKHRPVDAAKRAKLRQIDRSPRRSSIASTDCNTANA